jgi:hypothetical protein
MMPMLPEERTMMMNYPSSHKVGYSGNNIDSNIASKINNDGAKMANKNNEKDAASHQKKHFLLCEACFWCATYLINDGGTTVSKCPICNNAKVELMPIAKNEFYKFDYSPSSGLTFEFGTSNMNRR